MIHAVDSSGLALKAKLFRGFGDPSRLSLLEALRAGPLTVGELVAATRLSQSNVSNHLACLRDCGLVSAEPEGRRIIYRLSDDRVDDLMAAAEGLLADVAHGLVNCSRYSPPVSEKRRTRARMTTP
jgi:DNA-binding transcriptional ArsR family regulator